MGATDIAARALRMIGTLFGLHLEYAKREAANDASRLIGGAVLLGAAAALCGAAAFALSAAGILALVEYTQLSWLGAFLLIAAVDVGLGLILGLAGKSRFKGPIMKETRGMMKKTFSSLKEA